MKLKDLILEYRMEQDKNRRECSVCGGTFIPDDLSKPKLEKRCQACRTLGVGKDAVDEQSIEDLLDANLSIQAINTFISKLTPEEDTDTNKYEPEDIQKFLDEMFSQLNQREEAVIKLRYGLNALEEEYTLEEIAEMLGGDVSRERVRQIESSAIKKLKHPKVGRHLKNYLGY